MPDRDSVAGNARLLRGLIWASVLIAPIAAAVVLLGQSSNSVRFAVLLLAAAIVMIGASVLVRNDPVIGRMDVEDRVAEEVASLRRELRAEFGGGAPPNQHQGQAGPHRGPPRGNAPPPMPVAVPAPAAMRQQQPDEEPSGFFADFPAEGQYPDPFSNTYAENTYAENEYAENEYDQNQYAQNEYAENDYSESGYPDGDYGPQPVQPPPMPAGPPPMPAGPPPMGSARPPAGGRAGVPVASAGVPVASAAVRPPARTGPGLTTGGRQVNPPGGREPGTSTGGRVVAGAASVPPPQVPRQRGAASVPPPPPRAAASVRPAGAYGHQPDSLAEDFGASTGYAVQGPAPAQSPGVYGSPAGGGTYGAPAGTYGGGGNDFDSDEYNGYGAPNYGGDHDPADGSPRELGNTTGDPNYKARRHRPSANDTNVGSLSDFASYGGYQPDQGHRRP